MQLDKFLSLNSRDITSTNGSACIWFSLVLWDTFYIIYTYILVLGRSKRDTMLWVECTACEDLRTSLVRYFNFKVCISWFPVLCAGFIVCY